jgi:hypothetical protein
MHERRSLVRRQADRDLLEQTLDRRQADERSTERRRKRRHVIRHNCKAALDVQIGQKKTDGDGYLIRTHTIPGRILDLSATGASLFTHHAVEVGDDFRLVLLLENNEPIEAIAVARWVKRVEAKNGFASGIQFVKLNLEDQQRLERFLEQISATAGL